MITPRPQSCKSSNHTNHGSDYSRLLQHRRFDLEEGFLQTLAQRRDLDSAQDVACKSVRQQRARLNHADTARAQIEYRVVLELADRAAVCAADIIREDL